MSRKLPRYVHLHCTLYGIKWALLFLCTLTGIKWALLKTSGSPCLFFFKKDITSIFQIFHFVRKRRQNEENEKCQCVTVGFLYPDQALLAATEAIPVPGPARSGAGDGVGSVGAGAFNAEDSGWEVEQFFAGILIQNYSC